MNELQTKKAREVAERFGCAEDYVIHQEPFELPDDYVLLTIGAKKGRLLVFGISPQGEVSS